MALYVSDLLTATAAPVNATPASTRAWQWLRGSTNISGATSTTYTTTTDDLGSSIFATQLETNFLGTTRATSAATETVEAYNPAALFRSSEPGVWFDPNDITTLFQDAAGTTAVTTPGQTVGLMLDKSKGLVLGTELVVNGTFDSGTTGWSLTGDVTVVDGRLRMFNPSGGRPVVTQSFFEIISGGVVNCRILRADAATDIIAPNTGTGVFTALDTTTVFYMRSNNTQPLALVCLSTTSASRNSPATTPRRPPKPRGRTTASSQRVVGGTRLPSRSSSTTRSGNSLTPAQQLLLTRPLRQTVR